MPAAAPAACVALGTAVLASLTLVLAGCGGSSGADVAHLSSAAGVSPAGAASIEQPTIAYARCMRANGVSGLPEPREGRILVAPNSGVNRASPQFQAADKQCGRLVPSGTANPQLQRQAEESALKFSACIRAHGEPSFPNPEFSGDSVKLGGGKFDPNSPQFKAASKVCLQYFPGGPKPPPGGGAEQGGQAVVP
jgi:hypothetical protein